MSVSFRPLPHPPRRTGMRDGDASSCRGKAAVIAERGVNFRGLEHWPGGRNGRRED